MESSFTYILKHNNSKSTSERPYIRTSNKVLEEEDKRLSREFSAAEIYDKVLKNSDGPPYSQSQLSKPMDKTQIHRHKNKKRKEFTENNQKEKDVQLLIESLNNMNLIQSIAFKEESIAQGNIKCILDNLSFISRNM